MLWLYIEYFKDLEKGSGGWNGRERDEHKIVLCSGSEFVLFSFFFLAKAFVPILNDRLHNMVIMGMP